MNNPRLSEIADALMTARDSRGLLNPPSKHFKDFDLKAGYRIGADLHRRMSDRGFRPVGRKIGFTNKETWKEFNLRTPIWAHMYDKTVIFAEKGHIDLSLANMAAPRIEPEVVIKLAKDLSVQVRDPETILHAVEWIAMGFEIVDCHYPLWRFTAADAVADFGFHANLVIAPTTPVQPRALTQTEEQLRTFEVVLFKGSETVARGRGENALGSPLQALRHLGDVLANQAWAEPLRAGEVITTGTLTPLPAVKPGESWHIETTGIGLTGLSITFKG